MAAARHQSQFGQERTMLKLHVFNTGWVSVEEKHLYVGGGSTVRTLPVMAFVIEHPQGLVLFDTGLNSAFAIDPRRHVDWRSDRLIHFRSSLRMCLSAQMMARRLPPADVETIILSHLHYDHTGDLSAFPGAQVVVTRQEWQAAHSPLRRLRGYLDRECLGSCFELVDFHVEHLPSPDEVLRGGYGIDLLGDGTLILVPTFGHTAGHQSLLVFLPHGVVLLAGDAVYVREGYVRPVAQPHARFADLAWRSLIGLRALARGIPTAFILPSHDDTALHNLQRPDIATYDVPIPLSHGGAD
jgi:glyoxylase-like metal-dependent hydrolase (beta-lactamase superfamily II)